MDTSSSRNGGGNLGTGFGTTPTETRDAYRLWRKLVEWQDPQLWLLLVGRLGTAVAFSLFFPFFSIYLRIHKGIDMGTVGYYFLAFGAAAALAKVHGGILADRWGRKRVVVTAVTMRGVTFLGLGYLVWRDSPAWIMAMVVAASSYLGHWYIPAAHAMISDRTEGRKRVDAFGLFRVATNVGWAVGPLLGGVVPVGYYPHLLGGMAATYVGIGLLLLVKLRESKPRGTQDVLRMSDVGIILKDRAFLLFCLNILLIYTVMGQLLGVFAAYSVEFVGITTRQVGTLFFVNGAMVVALQVPLAALIRSRRMTWALFCGSLFYALGFGYVGLAEGFWELTGVIVVITVGEMIVQPAGLTLASRLAPEAHRGKYLGIFGLFNHLGWSFGPFLGGQGVDIFTESPWITWALVGGLAVVAAMMFVGIRFVVPLGADREDR